MGNFEIGDDIIDVRDIIERVENLRLVCSDEEVQELQQLESILDELGIDEQREGDWYPLTLIAEHHFTNYARELAEDCGMVNRNSRWPNNCIDWEEAARQLKYDYTEIDLNGYTYYVR